MTHACQSNTEEKECSKQADGSACFSVLLMLMLLLMTSKQPACSSL